MTTHENDPLTGDPQPHKPADDAEQVYFEGSPLVRGELATGWPWVLAGLALIAGPIVYEVMRNRANAGLPWYILVGVGVVGLLLLFVPWLKSKTIRYKISNYRVDVDRGLLSRRIDTLELWHVNDIQLNQSILERLLGVGTITVFSHDDTNPKLPMRGLPNPRPLFESVKQRIIAVKRQRGVVKMDVG